MTEEDWLTSPEPERMVLWLQASSRRVSRKLRLFVCGCCRLVWSKIRDPRLRPAVVQAERFADGLVTQGELYRTMNWLGRHFHGPSVERDVRDLLWWTVRTSFLPEQCAGILPRLCPSDNAPRQADLLRDVFGNPFRKVRHMGTALRDRIATWPDDRQPRDLLFVRDWVKWHDGTVRHLAREVYDRQAFDRMPILADALEEAGCDDRDLLEHCRSTDPHVRGCWVLDLLLGLE